MVPVVSGAVRPREAHPTRQLPNKLDNNHKPDEVNLFSLNSASTHQLDALLKSENDGEQVNDVKRRSVLRGRDKQPLDNSSKWHV